MCGIAGFFQNEGCSDEVLASVSEALITRGPDSSGSLVECGGRLALTHRRLAVLDLSDTGAQPIASSCGRFIMVFNGEIYNHALIRHALSSSVVWKGSSDSETLVESFRCFGIDKTLALAKGMFAIALWDRKLKVLSLIRDRFGEKPLYYGFVDDVFVFASELKAIKVHSSFSPIIDKEALGLFMEYGYVPAPWSIYENVKKVLPGVILSLAVNDSDKMMNLIGEKEFWNAREIASASISFPFDGCFREAVSLSSDLLRQSVGNQLLSDVPVGSLLSGGIDSTLITALMQDVSGTAVNTFTIGFDEVGFNEAPFAREVARYLGTNHNELFVTASDAFKVIPSLPTIYCEPFADSTQIPAFLGSKLAREHVKVVLTGDGGDELFGGYNRHIAFGGLWKRLQLMPISMRQSIGRLILQVGPKRLETIIGLLDRVSSVSGKVSNPIDKLIKLGKVMSSATPQDFYQQLVTKVKDGSDIVLGNTGRVRSKRLLFDGSLSNLDNMMLLDTLNYLPDDILVKVDRAAMSVSLETRAPMLDHDLFEFLWRLPPEYKVSGKEGKLILRDLVDQYVPHELIDRPKSGFAIPLASWLRVELRDWVEEILDEKKLNEQGLLNSLAIQELWQEHLNHAANHEHLLWNILMFQAWLLEQ